MAGNQTDSNSHINFGEASIQSTFTTITTAVLSYIFQTVGPWIQNKITSRNVKRLMTKTYDIFTCCNTQNPIEENLTTELDHNIYTSIIELSDYLYDKIDTKDPNKYNESAGIYTFNFELTTIKLGSIEAFYLNQNQKAKLAQNGESKGSLEKMWQAHESIVKNIEESDPLRARLSEYFMKWFRRGKCKVTYEKNDHGYLITSYYLGDYDKDVQGFAPLFLIKITDKSADKIISEEELNRGLQKTLNNSPTFRQKQTFSQIYKQNEDDISIEVK